MSESHPKYRAIVEDNMSAITDRYGPSFALALAIFAMWEGSVILFNVSSAVLPAPSLIAQTFIENYPIFIHHTYVTFQAIMMGFVIGSLVGIVSGIAVFYIPFFRLAFYPLLTMIAITPKIAFAPLLVIWFGAGAISKVLLAILVVFFPTLVNTYSGLTDINEDLLTINEIYGSSEWFIFWNIRIPNALPYLISGMKLGVVFAVIGTIVAEYIASSEGVGFLITQYSAYAQTARAFAALVSIVTLVLVLYGIAAAIERRLLFWYTDT